MPRKSSAKKPGVRKYGTLSNYSSEKLAEVLDKIKSGALTQRQAAKIYAIPRSTLCNKLKSKHVKPIGRPVSLSMEEEIIFRDHLLALSDVGIPVSLNDFKVLVKRYLDSAKKTVPSFTNNTPGYEWGKLFLERHPALKEKIAQNISRKRAQVNEEMVNKFFDHLTLEAEGVRPENFYNMDESGFHDDPGKQKLLFRRANRHPEIIRNATKSCFTIVFSGNAVGEFIPPFFIFKGKNCWSDWLQNGPQFSKMAVSKSGWIDSEIFEEWLEKHFIPLVDKNEGKKILICDNLSAHLSVKALKLCEDHNIKFICLIPNSTHLLQPLDVGYFASLKTAWRLVLKKWRQTQRGRKAIALPKNIFAQLVKHALEQSQATAGPNLMTGFRKCGLYPISRTEVLQTLPGYATSDIQASVSETFIEYLTNVRESDLNIKTTRKFQLPVKAGKAISAEEVEMFYKNKEAEQKKTKENPKKRGRPMGSKNLRAKKKKTVEKENEDPEEPNEGSEQCDLPILQCTNTDTENLSINEDVMQLLRPDEQENRANSPESDTPDIPRPMNSKNLKAIKKKTVEKENEVSKEQNDGLEQCDLPILQCTNTDTENLSINEDVVQLIHLDQQENRANSPESDTPDIPILATIKVSVHSPPEKRNLASREEKSKSVIKKCWVDSGIIEEWEDKSLKNTQKPKTCKSRITKKKQQPKSKNTKKKQDNEILLEKKNNSKNQAEPMSDFNFDPEKALEQLIGCDDVITGEFIVNPDDGQLVKTNEQIEVFEINKYCLFKDEGTLFPGQIKAINDSPLTLRVNCLTKNFEGGWKTPEKPDITTIDFKNIIKVFKDEKINKKGKLIYIDDDFLSMEWGE